MLENVLTHPKSRAYAVDPWLPMRKHSAEQMDEMHREFCDRIRRFGRKCRIYRGLSSVWLRKCNLPKHYFDVIYLDGDHYDITTLDDAVHCWSLLKIGGMIIFDDYNTKTAKKHHVADVVDHVFETIYRRFTQPIWKRSQAAYLKTGDITTEAYLPGGVSRSRGIPITNDKVDTV
jgi:predicted O-methyltransferase YrrM